MFRIASAMQAGDDNYSSLLNLEKYAIWKSPHACSAPLTVDDRKSQWVLRDFLNCLFNRECKLLAEC